MQKQKSKAISILFFLHPLWIICPITNLSLYKIANYFANKIFSNI